MGKVLHASYSGYFPFCIRSVSQIDNYENFFPVGMSLVDIMKLFWRVKEWKISLFSNNGNADIDTIITYSIFTPNGLIQKTISSENEIVCFRQGGSGGGIRITGGSFEANGDINMFGARAGVQKDVNTSLFYPYLTAEFSIRKFDDDGNLNRSEGYTSPSGITNPIPSGNLTIFNYTIPMVMQDQENISSLSAALIPASYWSYGETWNTATGQPL